MFTTQQNEKKSSNTKNIVIGVLAAAVIGLAGYTAYDKSNTAKKISQQEVQIAQVSDERSEIQQSFDASLARLDSMTGENSELQGKLTASTGEIAKMKSEIRGILNKKNATASELARARKLIGELNGRIENMEIEMAQLRQDNETLGNEKIVLTADKQKLSADLVATTTIKNELEKKVEVGSTLNAYNINITPINVKNSGKEKVSTTAKRVDKLVISFDVANRIAKQGTTDVYVVVTAPDGNVVSTGNMGSGMFDTREDGQKVFTTRLPIEVEPSKKRNVEFALSPGTSFQKGEYRIQIYQNGFLIGDGSQELKKGGLFG